MWNTLDVILSSLPFIVVRKRHYSLMDLPSVTLELVRFQARSQTKISTEALLPMQPKINK